MGLLVLGIRRCSNLHDVVDQDLQIAKICHAQEKKTHPFTTGGSVLTANAMTTVCPTSKPFRPAWMLMEFVQNTANSPI